MVALNRQDGEKGVQSETKVKADIFSGQRVILFLHKTQARRITFYYLIH